MPFTQVSDIRVYYEIHGAGAPLLLIHGLATRGEGFAHQLPALSQHFQTIIFDNRGVGKTEQPRGEYSIAQMADDAAGLLDALGVARAGVFGISMGGMIAQELALRHPHRVTKLALGCTHSGIRHCTPSPRWVTELFRTAGGKTRDQVVRDSIRYNLASVTQTMNPSLVQEIIARGLRNQQEPHAYFQQLVATFQFDSDERLPQLQMPALVLTGTEDVLIVPENSRRLAARIPNARLMEFAEAGHLFFIEKAEEVNAALIEFFR